MMERLTALLALALLAGCATPPLTDRAARATPGTTRGELITRMGREPWECFTNRTSEALVWINASGLFANATSFILTNGATAGPPHFYSTLPYETIRELVRSELIHTGLRP